MIAACWFANTGAGNCDGRLERAHLIPKQRLKREGLKHSAIWDPRVTVLACGRHHRAYDQGNLRIPSARVPPELVEFCEEHDLGWAIARYTTRGTP